MNSLKFPPLAREEEADMIKPKEPWPDLPEKPAPPPTTN